MMPCFLVITNILEELLPPSLGCTYVDMDVALLTTGCCNQEDQALILTATETQKAIV